MSSAHAQPPARRYLSWPSMHHYGAVPLSSSVLHHPPGVSESHLICIVFKLFIRLCYPVSKWVVHFFAHIFSHKLKLTRFSTPCSFAGGAENSRMSSRWIRITSLVFVITRRLLHLITRSWSRSLLSVMIHGFLTGLIDEECINIQKMLFLLW